MTIGNEATTKQGPTGRGAERFVETTLESIAQEGGSLPVNLRQISRRLGCAHTNVYNYFDSYGDLLWEAFRRAIRIYGEYVTRDLDTELAPAEYLRRTVANLASFPQQNPGLYRFIGSDPIDAGAVPADILETVGAMKRWFASVVRSAAGAATDEATAADAADIVLAYIDGETLNLINGRAVPGEDLQGRVEANALRLFTLLTSARDGRRRRQGRPVPPPDPASIFGA